MNLSSISFGGKRLKCHYLLQKLFAFLFSINDILFKKFMLTLPEVCGGGTLLNKPLIGSSVFLAKFSMPLLTLCSNILIFFF